MLERGQPALLSYFATLPEGKIVHTESTLLGIGPNGRLCLWPVMSEIPAILPHEEVKAEAGPGGGVTVVFASAPGTEIAVFREEITIQLNADRSLVYAHARRRVRRQVVLPHGAECGLILLPRGIAKARPLAKRREMVALFSTPSARASSLGSPHRGGERLLQSRGPRRLSTSAALAQAER